MCAYQKALCTADGLLDMARIIIDSDQILFNYIQLLKAVWVFRVCDVSYVLQQEAHEVSCTSWWTATMYTQVMQCSICLLYIGSSVRQILQVCLWAPFLFHQVKLV